MDLFYCIGIFINFIVMTTATHFIDDFASKYCHKIKENNEKPVFKEFVSFKSVVKNQNTDKVLFNSTLKECFKICQNSTIYYTAEIDESHGICKLFKQKYKPNTDSRSQSTVYTWHPCNDLNGVDNPSRCTGYWVYEKGSVIKQNLYKNYHNNLNSSSVADCANYCLSNRVCGGFNVYNLSHTYKTCVFLKYYNEEKVSTSEQKGCIKFDWKCLEHQKIDLETRCSNFRKGCVGKFVLKTTENRTTLPKYLMLNYKTRDYHDCIRNCERLFMCKFIVYSFYYAQCYLLSNTKTNCVTSFKPKTLSTFYFIEWQCCSQLSNPLSNQLGIFPHINERCICLKSINFRIRQLNCKTNFFSEILPQNSSSCRDAKLNCTVNQCFSWLKNWTIPMDNGSVIETFLIYTGYEEYLIQFTNNNITNFSSVFYVEPYSGNCRYYSAKLAHGNLNKFISRKDWNADNYPNEENKLTNSVNKTAKKYLLIGYQYIKWCPCSTEQSCEYQVIVEQAFHMGNTQCDFPFNFIVTQSGDVFVGIGFTGYYPKDCKLIQELSDYFAIGVFGNFKANFPSMSALESIKKLINTAVSLGYLQEDYVLYGSDYFKSSNYPSGKRMLDIIRLWKNYNSRKKIPCKSLTITIIVMNILGVVCMMMILGLAIKYYHRFTHSLLCGRILKLLEIEGCAVTEMSRFNIDERFKEHDEWFRTLKVMDGDAGIDLHNTSCFWLCDKQEISLFRGDVSNCQRLLENFLSLSLARYGRTRVSQMRLLLELRHCSATHITHFLYTPSSNILRKNLLIVCHMKKSRSMETMSKQLSLIINNYQLSKCFCKNVDLEPIRVSNETENMQIFEVKSSWDKSGCRNEKIIGQKCWSSFSGLRYYVN